jgi:hypothetical protein
MWTIVELDDGRQEFFTTRYEGFLFAKDMESERKHSVEYVAVIPDVPIPDLMVWLREDSPMYVFRGQELRYMLRSVDNVIGWIYAGRTYGEKDTV